MKTEIDKLNDRIDHLSKIVNDRIEVDKMLSKRIDIVNERVDIIKRTIKRTTS